MQNFHDYLLQTYGPRVAQNYQRVTNSYNPPAPRLRTERWISNRLHREKTFTQQQCLLIRSHHQAGLTCRELARDWGVSQGSISAVLRSQGAYKQR